MLIYLNGEQRKIDSELTVAALIEQLRLPENTFAVAVNEAFISRSQYTSTLLQPQDSVEIVSAMQGG